MNKTAVLLAFLLTMLLAAVPAMGQDESQPAPDSQTQTDSVQLPEGVTAEQLIAEAWDQLRGLTSVSVSRMVIHRPDWEREMTIKAWTRGREDSIFKILSPAKDKGNGTLKMGREMWTYNPKVNRTVKIPPSMMSQSWMGSDFSNNDLSKADSILNDYDHSLIGVEERDGVTVYTIESIPKPGAPVVWGKQQLTVREDFILLEEIFYDELMEPVKVLTMSDIQMMGGRLVARVLDMRKAGMEDEYTRIEYESVEFDVELEDSLFTLSSLSKPVR